jgi:hypothetical protein
VISPLTDQRTKIDCAQYLDFVSETFYLHVSVIRLVTDNLTIHTPAALSEAFPLPPEQAQRFC